MGPPKKKSKSTLNLGVKGVLVGALASVSSRCCFVEPIPFFVGGGCLKNWWLLRCATLSASVSFVQAFRFAGGVLQQ